MRSDVRSAIAAWQEEVEAETVRLIQNGVPPWDAVARARDNVSRRRAAGGTRCATCHQGKYPPQYVIGQWVHLYEDGSFIGPCFDPPNAPENPR